MKLVNEMFPKMEVEKTTKRKSFNVSVNGEEVWDGLSKGPPRRLKFAILDKELLNEKITQALS